LLHSALEEQRHVLRSQIYQETGPLLRDQARTGAALDEHIRDDSRHVKRRAPKTALIAAYADCGDPFLRYWIS
jgi:hypothetical protein